MKLGLRKILEAQASLCNWVNPALDASRSMWPRGLWHPACPALLCAHLLHTSILPPADRGPHESFSFSFKKISPGKKWNLSRLRYSWPELAHSITRPLRCVHSEGFQSLVWGGWPQGWNSGLHQHSQMTRKGQRVINIWQPTHLHLQSLKTIFHAALGAGSLRALQKLCQGLNTVPWPRGFYTGLGFAFPKVDMVSLWSLL